MTIDWTPAYVPLDCGMPASHSCWFLFHDPTRSDEMTELEPTEYLYLNKNDLTGVIPPNFFDKCTRLTELHFEENNFKGQLHSNIGFLKDLSELSFQFVFVGTADFFFFSFSLQTF